MAKIVRGRRARLPTGVPGLDSVLGGGALRGGIYVVRGAPGSGKTILGNQICFANARRGGRSAYITLLAESHARMMIHLESLDFFDPELVDGAVSYVSGYGALVNSGLRGVLDFVRGAVRPPQASRKKKSSDEGVVVVIDGFLAVTESLDSVSELKKFLHELQLYADLVNATVFLLAGPATSEARPEYTMVDGIIEMREQAHGQRAYRELQVRKLRGVGHLHGGHVFTISNSGIEVFPRIEALYEKPSQEDGFDGERTATGIEELDVMLGGGVRSGTTTLLLGPSGSGKTTFGLHYLASTPKDEKAVHFGFYETPARLLAKAASLGLALKQRVARGEIELVWQPSTEQSVDALAHRLLDAVDRTKATRVFIDGIDGFQRATIHQERIHSIFSALANELRVRGVTTLYTFEVPKFIGPGIDSPITGVSAIAENLIYLRFVELHSALYRLISILKVRDSQYDTSLREFHITHRGIRLERTFDSAEAILTGTAIRRA